MFVGLTVLVAIGPAVHNQERNQPLPGAAELSPDAVKGKPIFVANGCVACHTVDGRPGVGPSWLGMWGREEKLTDGRTVVVDEAYFRRSLREPRVDVVEGYPNVMLFYFLPDEDIEALIAFAKSLSPGAE